MLGNAQSWITSVAVTIALTVVSTGKTTGSSTANRRSSPNSKSLSGTKYESYSSGSPSAVI